MDSAAQADGEKRVDRFLIKPLMRRGLVKPTSMTKVQFADMTQDLCARLAYMSDSSLMALEEQAAGSPSGKAGDRFPIANRILEWAAQIQPPSDLASPLIRAVFAAQLGQDALAGGWAPELLLEVKRCRRWPNTYVVGQIKGLAGDSIRQMRRCDDALAQGDSLTPDDAARHAKRSAIIQKCRAIALLAQENGREV